MHVLAAAPARWGLVWSFWMAVALVSSQAGAEGKPDAARVRVEVGATWARLDRGSLRVLWQQGRGTRISWCGMQAFDPYPDELTVHDPGWKRTFYKSAHGRARAREMPADVSGKAPAGVEITDFNTHFRWCKRVTMPSDGVVRIEYEYTNLDRPDARLQLGFRPSGVWLSSAQFTVLAGGKEHTGRLGSDYSGRRILWSDLTRAEFRRPPFGILDVSSTTPMTLYDYRRQQQFWLGWDESLPQGRMMRAVVTISFRPFHADAAGIRLQDFEWTRDVPDGFFRVRGRMAWAEHAEGPRRVEAVVEIGRKNDAGVFTVMRRARTMLPVDGAPRPFEIALPVAARGRFTGSFRLSLPAGRKVLDLEPLEFEVRPMFEFYSRYSLYTDEADVVFHVRLVPEVQSPAELRVRLADAGGITLKEGESFPGSDLVVRVPRTRLADGLHHVTAELVRGEDVVDRAVTRFCVAAPSPSVVKIDRRTRGLIVDGRPFFPFGFYVHKGRFYDATPEPQYVLNLEAPYKFNLVCPYHNFDAAFRRRVRPVIERFLDRAEAVGLYVHYDIRRMCCAEPSAQLLEAIEEEVRHFRNAPALLCWYLADEPAGQRIPPERFIRLYPRLKRADPYHPATMVFCVPSKAHEYVKGLDIVMVDPYPIPNRPVTQVAETIDLVRKTVPAGTPIWCVPQAFGGGEAWGREPTPEEERCMTYLAVLHGATGIQYFIRRPPMNNPFTGALWGEIRRMACEIRELTPVLLSPLTRPNVEVDSEAAGVEATAYRWDGEVWVLCVNTRNAPASYSVRCDARPAGGAARVVFRNRSIPVRADGVIRDWIDGLGVRIYAFREVTPHRDRPDNLLRNGDFEKQANVGFPDYFRYAQGADFAASWGTDSTMAHTGRHSLFIRNPGNKGAGPAVVSFPMMLGKGSYDVTLFARADPAQAGLTVSVSGSAEQVSKTLSVPGSWTAFHLTFAGPAKRWRVHLLFRLDSRGVVWIDTVRVVAASQ